eukprot:2782390-Alexandrium_andersonii.AAC.1
MAAIGTTMGGSAYAASAWRACGGARCVRGSCPCALARAYILSPKRRFPRPTQPCKRLQTFPQ